MLFDLGDQSGIYSSINYFGASDREHYYGFVPGSSGGGQIAVENIGSGPLSIEVIQDSQTLYAGEAASGQIAWSDLNLTAGEKYFLKVSSDSDSGGYFANLGVGDGNIIIDPTKKGVGCRV